MVFTGVSEEFRTPVVLPATPRPGKVLFTAPDFFQVEYSINPHMEGMLGAVDAMVARQQWDALRAVYERLGFDVHTVPGVRGLPDMVFCANQTLPYRRPDGDTGVVLSRMHARQRQPEVEHYRSFFLDRGYDLHELDPPLEGSLEGMGDAIWHPGRFLLWGGHGFRTDLQVYEWLSEALGFTTVALRLEDPYFYHLDTCLSPLDERTALIFPGAFDDEGLTLLERGFERLLEAPENEARRLLAVNAHCPDGKHVIIQKGCEQTSGTLRQAGFEVIEVETGEFLKAGGSVFCLKLMFW
jgi:N-dimethylarginine dimethylaminohydrolase